jgi:hypothetical protein
MFDNALPNPNMVSGCGFLMKGYLPNRDRPESGTVGWISLLVRLSRLDDDRAPASARSRSGCLA